MSPPGVFITLEGGEGAGKTTQAPLLAAHLERAGHRVAPTREPGGTAIGAAIRAILLDPASANLAPEAELLLYAADRAQHLAELIIPSLEQGKIVICDRFYDATLAYQGYGRGLDPGFIGRIHANMLQKARPHLTLFFDCPVEKGLARAKRATHHSEYRFEAEETAFHERVRKGYLALCAAEPERFRIINAEADQETVRLAMIKAVDDFLRDRK